MRKINLLYVTANVPVEGIRRIHLPLEVIVGVQLPGSAPVSKKAASGRISEVELSLPDDQPERIQDFFRRAFVERQGSYDGRSFISFVMGQTTRIDRFAIKADIKPAASHAFKPGKFYGTSDEGGQSRQLMLGIHNPGLNLSVLGENGIMAVTKNMDLLYVYGGDRFVEFTPK